MALGDFYLRGHDQQGSKFPLKISSQKKKPQNQKPNNYYILQASEHADSDSHASHFSFSSEGWV